MLFFSRRIIPSLFLFLSVLFSASALPAATLIGEAPTGELQLPDYKLPVWLYVPPTYSPAKEFPLLIVLPAHLDSTEATFKEWVKAAKNKSYLVLAPDIRIRDNDTPIKVDEWLLTVKSDVMNHYRINKEKIFLVGKKEGAEYAAYLGVKYPDQFSGVGLIEGSWLSPFEKMANTSSRSRKQVPFYVALSTGDADFFHATETKAYELNQKGYPVHFEKLEDATAPSASPFKMTMLKWLDETSEQWATVVAGNNKSLKEKVSLAVEDFFSVK